MRSPSDRRRRSWLGECVLAASLLAASPALAEAPPCTIDNPWKIGVGAVAQQGPSRLARDLARVNAAWYYDWWVTQETSGPRHVPMIWTGRNVEDLAKAEGDTLLAFNEPDHTGRPQSAMTVEEALSHWPALMASGKRLGSPAVQTGNELGAQWLGRFMAEAERRGYRVDFIAVHYYSTDADLAAFERYLEVIHAVYQRPIWVTEWSLADWSNEARFSAADQAAFFRAGAELMDDLPYVERHAWFGLYEGQDGWDISTGLIDDGRPTEVGEAFLGEVSCTPGPDRAASD